MIRWGVITALILLACSPVAAVGASADKLPASMNSKRVTSQGATIVTVSKGDSLYLLAKRHGLSSRAIIDANNLKPPYKLLAGSRLKLPVSRTHKVSKGDTLYTISRQYGVDMNSLVTENQLKKPYGLMVGQSLKIPQRTYSKAEAQGKVAAKSSTSNLATRTSRASHKAPAQAEAAPYVSAKTEFSPNISRGQFTWPMKGKIISRFGSNSGLHSDGINIAARDGDKIYSAASGEVVYAGNELKGYGNMVIIQHEDGWITAYAHTRAFTVRKGHKVQKGQLIAYAGDSGGADKPQLYFAIRKGRKAVDPLRYLPS